MKKLLILTLLPLILSGCKSLEPITHEMKNTFDITKAKKQLEPGSSTIIGNAFLRQNGGGVVTCAGSTVYLGPYTDYMNERIKVFYNNTEKGYLPAIYTRPKFTSEDPEYKKNMKTTICKSDGSFKFENLKQGDYFITMNITWYVGYNIQGGSLMQKVHLNKSENKEIILAD